MTYTISKEVVRTHEHWTQFVHAHLRHAPPWNWCILHAWRCRLFDRPSGWRVCHQQPVLWSLSQDHRCCKSQVMPHEKRPRSQRRLLRRILLLQVAHRIASGVLGVRVKKKEWKTEVIVLLHMHDTCSGAHEMFRVHAELHGLSIACVCEFWACMANLLQSKKRS